MKKQRSMQEEAGAAMFAKHITSCAYSEQGCGRLPVKMIVELQTDPSDPADAEFIMLCIVHRDSYQPSGPVVFDQALPTADLPPDVLHANPTQAEREEADQIMKQIKEAN